MSAESPATVLSDAATLFAAGDSDGAVRRLWPRLGEPAVACRLREWALAERRLDLLPGLLAVAQAAEPESRINQAVAVLLRGDAGAAWALLDDAALPVTAGLLHHRGRALHNLGQRAQAQQSLREALRLQPNYPEAWYSLAHALRADGQLAPAAQAYREALAQMPGLRAAWLNLGITLCALEQPGEALAPLQRLLALDPRAVEGWINLGLCQHLLGDVAAAQASYAEALRLAPEHPQAHHYLGCLLNEAMATEPARQHLQAALRAVPDDPDVLAELAGLLEQTNDLAAAEQTVAHGLQVAPGHPGLSLEAARLDRRGGRIEQARTRLLALSPAVLPARQAQQYWFERALAHDRADEPAAALQALQHGHALAARSPRRQGIDREAFPRRIAAIDAWLAQGAPGAGPQPGDPQPDWPFRPAFLVGFPRSGTTLLDTLLDAHPQVASIEERATVEAAGDLLEARGSGYPAHLARATAADLADAQMAYRQAVAAYLPTDFTGVLLDKLPLRMLRVPLIRRLFPAAPLLFAVRHPCDVVLSNVMQQYAPNEAFVHFDSLADAARSYDRVMRCWRRMLGQLELRPQWIVYEDLVQAPERVLAEACAALGLAPVAGMLDPASRLAGRGRIQTNSYQQVAEPLYRRAAGRWQRYREWLQPHLPLLQPHIEWLGYGAAD